MVDFTMALVLETNNTESLKYCKFPAYMLTTRLYYCYQDENCCDNGCCPSSSFGRFPLWEYCWLCQHPKCTASQSPNSRTISLPSYEAPYPRRSAHFRTCPSSSINRHRQQVNRNPNLCRNIEHETLDTSVILDRLLVSLRNRPALGSDPPSYHSVVKYSNSSKMALYGPPPSYSVIIRKNNENNATGEGPSTDCTPSNSNNLQTHQENGPQSAGTSINGAVNENIVNVEIHRCDNEEGKTDETPKDSST
ncbi:uncharacterized protein LOC108735821 isoform X2 [Agrilus planipennis]|uniref:Uncharacterized protein LOC108735821 isoform X2 n=1 Tax=Agrilus planipennis TaxID=224129 RepID=A0A1W4WTX2_AGRPL|nr:uncharacterized protein LOC108735821 isoform X2 [Agrilus planipennis]